MADFPSQFEIREVKVNSFAPNWREEAENLEQSIRSKAAHRWEVRIVSTRMPKMRARVVFGELQELQGGASFNLVLPGYTDRPNGVASGTPLVRSNAAAGNTQLQLQGGAFNQAKQHMPGDYFKVDGHNKVYMITKVANTNGQGQTTIHFKPGLRKSVSAGALVIVRNVEMVLHLRRDALEFTARSENGEITYFELDCYEDIR